MDIGLKPDAKMATQATGAFTRLSRVSPVFQVPRPSLIRGISRLRRTVYSPLVGIPVCETKNACLYRSFRHAIETGIMASRSYVCDPSEWISALRRLRSGGANVGVV